jgi:hypothetical protein
MAGVSVNGLKSAGVNVQRRIASELIHGDGVTTVSYVNGAVIDGGRRCDRAGLVVTPDLFARRWVVSGQVAAAITYK